MMPSPCTALPDFAQGYKIRAARQEDVPHLLSLMSQLGYPQTLSDMHDILGSYIHTPHHHVFVAVHGDLIQGLVAMTGIKAFVYTQRIYRVMGLVIDHAYRGQGIGRALMMHAETVARHHGGKVMDLTSSLRRAQEGTHDFYRSLGYSNDGDAAKVYFRKVL